MSNIKKIIKYLRNTGVPKVMTYKSMLVTLYLVNNGVNIVVIKDDTEIGECLFTKGSCLLSVIQYVTQFIDGDENAALATVFSSFQEITSLPKGYQISANWLIEQFESGNKTPLVERVQSIVGDTGLNEFSTSYADDYIVFGYYRDNCNLTQLKEATTAAQNLRVALVRLSTCVSAPSNS